MLFCAEIDSRLIIVTDAVDLAAEGTPADDYGSLVAGLRHQGELRDEGQE